MKKSFLTKMTFLALAFLCLGTGSAWGEDTYTTLYQRTLTGDSAWCANDVTAWGSISGYGIVTEKGFGKNALETSKATKTFSVTANAKVKYEIEWYFGGASGRNANGGYVQFGKNIRLLWDGKAYKIYLSTNGTHSLTTLVETLSKNTFTKSISIILDKAKKQVEKLVYNGTDITSFVSGSFSDDEFNTFTIGLNKGGSGYATDSYIKSIIVSECKQTVQNVSYTVKFQDESGNTLKDDTTYTNGTTVGAVYQASATDMATFYDNAETPTKKYVYKSGQNTTATATATASDNVITLVFSTYNKTAYAVKAIDGESNELGTLATGEAFLDGSSKAYYKKCIEHDGKLYEQVASPFSVTINAAAINVTFTAADYGYYFEQSDLTLSNNKGSYAATLEKDYMSNGDGSRLYKNQTAYTTALPAGVYQVVISAATYKNTPTLTYGYRIDDVNTTLGTTETWTNGGYFASKTLDNVIIPEDASFAFINTDEDYNSNVIIDYVTLKKTGEISGFSYTKNLSTTGFASFSAPVNVTVPDGTYAYKAAISGSTVTLTKVEGVIPANTGVILYNSKKPSSVTLTGKTEAGADYSGNELIATSIVANRVVKGATDKAYTYYALNASAATFGQITADITLSDNKAYLKVDAAQPTATALTIAFGDDATGIESAIVDADAENNVIYNVYGIRVDENYKGLVIVNGKKYLKK